MKVAKPQSIYVPVCLCSLVPSKSSSIWTNLKNKAYPGQRPEQMGRRVDEYMSKK